MTEKMETDEFQEKNRTLWAALLSGQTTKYSFLKEEKMSQEAYVIIMNNIPKYAVIGDPGRANEIAKTMRLQHMEELPTVATTFAYDKTFIWRVIPVFCEQYEEPKPEKKGFAFLDLSRSCPVRIPGNPITRCGLDTAFSETAETACLPGLCPLWNLITLMRG